MTDTAQPDNGRLALWLNFVKAVIVTGALGTAAVVAPAWISAEIKKGELEIKAVEQDLSCR